MTDQKAEKGISVADCEQCCGCGCCSEICGNNAIQMIQDEKGFFRPLVLRERCSGCGLCISVCPLRSEPGFNTCFSKQVYAVIHKNERIRKLSSLGGAFSALARKIISGGGHVYGAVYTGTFEVVHMGASNKAELGALRGSKYVQSKFWSCIPELIKHLRQGKRCMVVGTPCQIHGLRNLSKIMNVEQNLYLVDLICHGVPSQKLFQEHIRTLEKRHGKILRYRSRSKMEGWHTYFDRIFAEHGEVNPMRAEAQVWRRLFASNVCLQEGCYTCEYASTNRVADLTLGDFWGIEKRYPDKDDNCGCSLVIVNTQKGEQLFREAADEIEFFTVSMEDAMQKHLQEPCHKPGEAACFWKEYQDYGWKYVSGKYGRQTTKMLVLRWLNRLKFKRKYSDYEEPFGEVWKA